MRSMQLRWKHSVLCALTILLIMPALAGAQDYRGKVQGVVTDSGKAALANAKVGLRNEGTGVEVTHQTNADGHYIFDVVESGSYSLQVEVQGFKKYEQRNIEVRNRADVTVDARLEVGGLSEVITVQDSPVGVKFNTSSDILTIDNKLI